MIEKGEREIAKGEKTRKKEYIFKLLQKKTLC